MEHFKPPEAMRFEGNISENWRRWLQRYELYLAASGAVDKDDKIKVAILLHAIGDEGIDIFNTFTFDTEGDEAKLAVVVGKFHAYCNPRKNTVMERYSFWERSQKEGETIDQFVTALKNRAKNCEFGDQKDFMIRDRIIFGVREARLKERLLRDSADPRLERVIELCRASEASSKQVKELSGTVTVSAITNRPKTHKYKPPSKSPTHGQTSGGSINNNKQNYHHRNNKQPPTVFSCRNCGRTHGPRECPAYGQNCLKCHNQNHFAKMCRGGKQTQGQSKIHALEEDSNSSHPLFIGAFQIGQLEDKTPRNAWFENLKLEGGRGTIRFKLDTGAEANVLPQRDYMELVNKPNINKTRATLTAYDGHELRAPTSWNNND